MIMNSGKYLTPAELVERYKGRISLGTLANWRCLGNGPEYTKVGGRILYPLEKVEDWERKSTFPCTANYGRS